MSTHSILRFETIRRNAKDLDLLNIDRSLFSRQPDKRLEESELAPVRGGVKDRPEGYFLCAASAWANAPGSSF